MLVPKKDYDFNPIQIKSIYKWVLLQLIQTMEEDQGTYLQTSQQKQLFELITGRIQPRFTPLDLSIFEVDLVIKFEVPNTKFKSRNDVIPLSNFVVNPPSALSHAYSAAYQQLFVDAQAEIQKQIMIRDFDSLKCFPDSQIKKYILRDDGGNEEVIGFECHNQYNGILDGFTVRLNSLVYVLQKLCGFKLKMFMVTDQQGMPNESHKRELFIFVSQTTENMLKVAERHQIKLQIDYSQLDLFINDPTDRAGRPLKYHSKIQQENNQIKLGELNNISHEEQNVQRQPNQQHYSSKQIIRKWGADQPRDIHIIEEAEMSSGELKNYQRYQEDHQKKLFKLFGHNIAYQINNHEKVYLYEFNRGKINPGVQKQYVKIKKKRAYYRSLQKMAKDHGYATYQPEKVFAEFIPASKNKNFFDRLRSILFYHQKVVSPNGDLSLFVKAERIKICYLTLREHIRVENLSQFNCIVFALNDDFDKYGSTFTYIPGKQVPHDRYGRILGNLRQGPKGGLDGDNLVDEWSHFRPYPVMADPIALRNYLGESVAFNIHLSNHLLFHFLAVTPLSIAGELFSQLYVDKRTSGGNYLPEFIFHSVFFVVVTVIYGIFMEVWNQREGFFLEMMVEKQTNPTFRDSFRGPLVRNPITDNVNQYIKSPSFRSRFKQLIFFLIVGCVLGLNVAFFYWIRTLTIQLDLLVGNRLYFIVSPSHLIPYAVFFITNLLLYKMVMRRFLNWLTVAENLPTNYAFKVSLDDKTLLYVLGLQLIGPVDLLLVEPLNRTNCYGVWCYRQFQLYIYSRYVIIFFLILIEIIRFIFKASDALKNQAEELLKERRDQPQNYKVKFQYFLQYVQKEALKQEYQEDLTSLTLVLFFHGIFMTTFPLSAAFGLAGMAVEYALQKRKILLDCRRPISKSEKFLLFTSKYYLIMHLSFFINCWILIFTLQELEYQFQFIIEAFEPVPTRQGILTLKILGVVALVIVFQVIAFLVRIITRQLSSNQLRQRQRTKIKQYLSLNINSATKKVHSIHPPVPMKTIFRVFHSHPSIKHIKKMGHMEDEEQMMSEDSFQMKVNKTD